MSTGVGRKDSDQESEPLRLRSARTLAEAAWFPAVLFVGFLFCFGLALHAPEPHHAHVAVAGAATADEVETVLARSHPGGFDITPVSDAAQAREAVRDRTAVAGFAAGDDHPVLFVANANGASLGQAVTDVFTEVVGGDPQQLTVQDVAPTVGQDRLGSTLVYFGIAWSVPGYILATTLLRAVTFDRRRKVLSILGVSAVFSVIGYGAGLGLGFLPQNPVTIPVAFLLTTAVATFASGLAPFTRQFFPAVGMTLFIVLSIPTSGGVAPAPMLPTAFQYIHAVMPLGNAVDALRSALYFDGAGLLKPLLVLCAWTATGVALLALDAHLHRRRTRLDAEQQVEEPPVEDPALESPVPTALPVHPHHFGETAPDLVGTVRDAEARPVRHAAVTVLGPSGRHLVTTSTNAQGKYAVAGLPEGYLGIVVTAPGQQSVARRELLRPGNAVRTDVTLVARQATAQESVGP